MTYNIMGVNPGHNGSVALVSDGEVVYYVEEERLSRQKYDGNPFRGMIDIMSKWHVDELIITGTTSDLDGLPWTGEDAYTALVRKFNPKVKVTRIGHEHHLGHATAFYNSGFNKAVCIVIDGAGSKHSPQISEDANAPRPEGYETESILTAEYPADFKPIFKSYGNNTGGRIEAGMMLFDDAVTYTKAYEAVSQYLGFGFIEAGKTMGLAPYGKDDKNIPPLFFNGRGSKDVFIPSYPAGAYIDQARIPYLKLESDPREWHKDPEKLPEKSKNLAFMIQRDTQAHILHLIKQAVEITGIKNVVISGGYGLNCVANYFFRKNLPSDINLYCEPIAHDGGTSIGAALLAWHINSRSVKVQKQTSIYYGPQYSLDTLQAALDKNSDKIKTTKVDYADVAKLIADRNIVSLFQGRSEAGPRALGNRSIVYDPTDVKGKDYVNTVKGREWFRPFAGSVLAEDASDWFDLAGMEESPHMMYAVNVAADKVRKIPAITHVDDTCRVQTVTEEQNKHYYNLIKAFKDITGVPVVFNTSFNLAGEPLVETIDDALETLYSSKLKYMYLPELDLLVEKTIPDPEPEPEPEPESTDDNDNVIATTVHGTMDVPAGDAYTGQVNVK